MQILLVRHGAAVTAVGRLADEDRWLADDGRQTTRRVGTKWAELGLRPDVVYTSPLVRAVQTAELLGAALGCERIEVHPPLAIDAGTTTEALSVLERLGADQTAVLVTHEPKIRSLAGTLGRMRSFPGFATSGSVLFRGERGATSFAMALNPRTLSVAASFDDMLAL